jgi:predicted CopG family antitoxin
MARKSGPPNSPLTFDLPVDLYEGLVRLQGKLGKDSVSAVVREIVSNFDFAGLEAEKTEHRQISVRIETDKRKQLLKLAKQKRTSAGELLRRAIMGYKPAAKAVAKPSKPSKSAKPAKKAARR